VPACYAFLLEEWDQAEMALPEEGETFFSEEAIGGACAFAGMSAEPREALLETRRLIERNPLLRRLAWQAHYLLFHSPHDHWRGMGHWPMLPAEQRAVADLFNAVVLISGVPHMAAFYTQLGIPIRIATDTLKDIELWMREYRTLHGRWGLVEYPWLVLHLKGDVFALGRLQFQFCRFPLDFHAWHNPGNGQRMLFAGDSMWFRRDGQFNGTNGWQDGAAWTTAYVEDETSVTGYPIDARQGVALHEPVTLAKSEWQLVLEKETPVIGVHIPATGPMTPEKCIAAYAAALDFFPRYFPAFAFKAFDCESWLLDAQLRDYLPAGSNIVRFMDEYRLYPWPNANDGQTLERIFGFGTRVLDLDRAPRDTALRRAIVAHMRNGGRWRQGGGLIF
jgi:hypothetical protein